MDGWVDVFVFHQPKIFQQIDGPLFTNSRSFQERKKDIKEWCEWEMLVRLNTIFRGCRKRQKNSFQRERTLCFSLCESTLCKKSLSFTFLPASVVCAHLVWALHLNSRAFEALPANCLRPKLLLQLWTLPEVCGFVWGEGVHTLRVLKVKYCWHWQSGLIDPTG